MTEITIPSVEHPPGIVCPKCGAPVRAMLTLIVSIPGEMWGNITKRNIAKKEFELWGANWDTAFIKCTECGYQVDLRHSNDTQRLWTTP